MKKNLQLFWTFLKIGAFTFGGGLAMLPFIENEVVDKRGWISKDEILDLIAIAESTPGPIAVNCATYIGYKINRFWGAFFATFGLILPSFIIIIIIAIAYTSILSNKYLTYLLAGLKAGVAALVLSAGIRIVKKLKYNPLLVLLPTAMALLLFVPELSAIIVILIGGLTGLLYFCLTRGREV